MGRVLMRMWKRAGLLAVAAAMAMPVHADVMIDFEGLSDGEQVQDQYAGLTFERATMAATTGIWLNEFEFPPHSGANVVFDDGAALAIVFSHPVARVGGYFTYLARLAVSAYDAADNRVAWVTSNYGSNLALSGDVGSAANELLEVVDSSARIRRVVIAGDPFGGSFALDDLMFSREVPVSGVPEPSTLLLVAAGLVGLARRRVAPGG